MWKRAIYPVVNLGPTRAHGLAYLFVLVAAGFLCFVPLFNLLGYESAAFFGVVLGVLSTGLTVWSFQQGVIERPLGSGRREGPARDFGRLALLHLAMIPGPMILFGLNSLRVPNCDWAVGLGFWALIPTGAIFLGQGAAFVAAGLVHRTWLIWVLAFAFPLADALAMGLHLVLEPPIIGHQWFLGYFGGSIYDEALAVPMSLVLYRGLHLLAMIAVLASLEAVYSYRQGRAAHWLAGLAILASLGWSAGVAWRQEAGIALDGEYIQEALGGVVETEHFVIYYPDRREWRARIDELAEDHEFRYHQLREFFQTDPVVAGGRKLRSYVYAGPESKGRLMGGRNTMVAKIWLGEMHILWRGPGDHMIAHEMAHLFTAPFASGPLQVSMQRGIGVNMGLVEGVAAAAEWPSSQLTPHESMAAMRSLGIAPDLRKIFGAQGFWTQASGPAYTATGSFVRYLIDREGVEKFKRAYGRGDFEGAYGRVVETLIEEWEGFIDGIELTEKQKEIARFRFDRPSIFGRECARARAELRRRARQAVRRGAAGEARRCYGVLLADNPADISAVQEYVGLLVELEQFEEALDLIARRPREGLSMVQEAQFLDLKGDLLWKLDRGDQASTSYEDALQLGVPLDQERSLRIKHYFARRSHSAARAYLLGRPEAIESIWMLAQWRAIEVDEAAPLVQYLLARRLYQARMYAEAATELDGVPERLPWASLQDEARWMRAQSLYFQQEFSDARREFETLQESELSRYREGARDWIRRVRWAQE